MTANDVAQNFHRPCEERLRIVHIAPMPFPASFGSQVYVAHLCGALARLGHDVTIACYNAGSGAIPAGVRLVRGRAVPGGDFVRSGPHWSRLAQDVALARAVSRLKNVDIFHGHNVEGPLVARLSAQRGPVVYGQHTSMREELPQWLPYPGMGWAGRLVDAVVPRLATASAALSRSGLSTLPSGSAVCPPGVDLADLSGADGERARVRYGLDERPWVVYAGNGDPYQDIDRWLMAMRDVPMAGALLVVGGDAEPWRRLARELGLPPERTRIVGGADFLQMKDALAAATIAVCPRRLCRGFPIKLLNQLALGCPTVCAPGSAREIDGVVRVSGEAVEDFARTVRTLLADPGRIRFLGEAAKRDVARRWTWDARAEDLVAVYRRLVAQRR